MNKDDENLEQPHAGRIVDSITTTGTSAPTVGDEAGEPWDKWEIETLISHIRNPENAKWLTGWSPLQIDLIVDGLKSLQRTLDASPTITEGEAMTDPAPTPRFDYWKRQMEGIGAWDHALVSVPAKPVQEIVEELGSLERTLSEHQAKHTAIMKEADRRYNEQTAMLSAAEERVRGMEKEIAAVATAPWTNFADAEEFRAWALNRCRAALAPSAERKEPPDG